MNSDPDYEALSATLRQWMNILSVLIRHLTMADEDASKQALAVVLMEGLRLFGGPDAELMKQCFPVLDAIRNQIEVSDLDGALRQTLLLKHQLDEVRELVCSWTN